MITPAPSEREIQARIYQRIINETTITAPMEDSFVGVLMKIFAAEYKSIWDYVKQLRDAGLVWTATGTGLDDIGYTLGVPRKADQQASTRGLARAVRFTNLGGSNVTIPTGTRVFKDSDPTVAFFTTEAVTLTPGSRGEVHVDAASTGETYNVAIGDLTRSSLPSSTVSVTNILPIQNGSFQESDDSYRERIVQEFRRRDVFNPDTCIALLRSVPGVKDVLLLDQRRGPGTFDAIIIPYNENAASMVVAACQALLRDNKPIGVSGKAKAPTYRQVDITAALVFSKDVGERRESIRENIRAQIAARIDALPVEDGSGNGTFYVSQIRPLIIDADISIVDATVSIGIDGSPLATEGQYRLSQGERLTLRGLTVQ